MAHYIQISSAGQALIGRSEASAKMTFSGEHGDTELGDTLVDTLGMQDSIMTDFRAEDDLKRYDLRISTMVANANNLSTWMDQDDTGDYDPLAKDSTTWHRRPRQHQRPATTRTQHASSVDNNQDDQEEITQPEPVILKFRSLEGLHRFRAKVSGDFTKSNEAGSHSGGRYAFRGRTLTLPDSARDLTGHPLARGCWECAKLGIECTLLHDEREWPCLSCAEDGQDCDLITPPVRKRACERCKRSKEQCSLPYEVDQAGPCRKCSADGAHCIAGPVKDYIPVRARYDRDWKSDPKPLVRRVDQQTNHSNPTRSKAKTKWSCLECQHARRTCSFFYQSVPGDACTACEMSGNFFCVPVDLCAATLPASQPPKPPTILPEAKNDAPRRTIRTVETRFRYPIVFNHTSSAGISCNFCKLASFAILGLAPQTRRVVESADGRVLDEVPSCPEAERTHMCVSCTTARLFTIVCERHEFQPLSRNGMSGIPLAEHKAALQALFEDRPRSTDRWCSVCPSLAEHECVTVGARTATMDNAAIRGCGLALCGVCMTNLRAAHGAPRGFQDMLARLRPARSNERPLGLRADWDLLRDSGLLMRSVMSGEQSGRRR